MENKRINMVAMFEKVSYEQFKKDLTEGENTIDIDDTALKEIYDNIELPRRATEGSAGYDFFLPYTPCHLDQFRAVTDFPPYMLHMHSGSYRIQNS